MNQQFEDIITQLEKIVRCCRTGDYADAASAMNVCMKEIEPFLITGAIPIERINKIVYSLETIFLFQQQNDWVAVADIIEFELIGLLKSLYIL